MQSITHKTDLKKICGDLQNNPSLSLTEQVAYVHKAVLKKKVKFPLLEYLTKELSIIIPRQKQIAFLDEIVALDEIGSYTITGKLLQLRIEKNLSESLKKAEEYIITADKWYACDIIGERVFGFSLLKYPDKIIPVLKKLSKHRDKWMVRSIGVAGHYAIKKGLDKATTEILFKLLLSLSNTTDFHTKKGIGWAAKTTSKFHPDIIKKYKKEIYNDPEVQQWFKTKIKIGLSRSYKYAGLRSFGKFGTAEAQPQLFAKK
jgi:3-methyladenine DNA glycosylase AlkD